MNYINFLSLKHMSINEILEIFKDINLEYRNVLDNIIPNFTFGTEIEFEKYDYKELYPLFRNENFKKWKSVYDRSVIDGGEVVSDVLYNKEIDWKKLKEICGILKEKEVKIGGKAGGHIHIGAHILEGNIEYWLSLLKIWTVFEPVLYQFSYGEKGYPRSIMRAEAIPFNNALKETINKLGNNKDTSQLIYLLKDYKRNKGINFRNVSWDKSATFEYKNTIEFRLFNGSINETIWQNNVNMLLNLFNTIINREYDKEWIDYQFNKEDSINNLDFAIAFADMIYTSDIDKLYFLRQYLQKNYLEQEKEKKYLKTI